MPALVAMRFNPDLKAKYQALKAAGKPAKGRHHRIDAKAHHPRKRSPQGAAKMGP
ncbi:hypothetical protein NKH63_18425 [Mesorhizobium sp. M0960]